MNLYVLYPPNGFIFFKPFKLFMCPQVTQHILTLLNRSTYFSALKPLNIFVYPKSDLWIMTSSNHSVDFGALA